MYESTGKVLSVKGNMIITDAFVEPGNSGSAVLNSKYEVVGVHLSAETALEIKVQKDMVFISLLKLRNSLQITQINKSLHR